MIFGGRQAEDAHASALISQLTDEVIAKKSRAAQHAHGPIRPELAIGPRHFILLFSNPPIMSIRQCLLQRARLVTELLARLAAIAEEEQPREAQLRDRQDRPPFSPV